MIKRKLPVVNNTILSSFEPISDAFFLRCLRQRCRMNLELCSLSCSSKCPESKPHLIRTNNSMFLLDNNYVSLPLTSCLLLDLVYPRVSQSIFVTVFFHILMDSCHAYVQGLLNFTVYYMMTLFWFWFSALMALVLEHGIDFASVKSSSLYKEKNIVKLFKIFQSLSEQVSCFLVLPDNLESYKAGLRTQNSELRTFARVLGSLMICQLV